MIKYIRKILIVYLVIMLVVSSIVSMDSHHIEFCHKEECSICFIIEVAQDIFELTTNIFEFLLLSFITIFLYEKIEIIFVNIVNSTLVNRNVQLNE